VGRGRYLLLCSALFLLLWAHSWSDAWLGDFWIYTATVAELAASPLHPRHPLFGNDFAFAFLSPYTWALGVAARLSGLSAFQVVVLQGFVNLALLAWAVHAFVATWLRRPAASFYAMLFILLLWAPDAWRFSGFLHLRSLAFVLPYPSTFAFAVALGTLAWFPKRIESGSSAWAALVVPIMATLWILHPVNGLFLTLGLLVASVETARPVRHWVTFVLVFAASLGLAFAWPLFPVADLWFGQLGRVHEGNDTMYQGPLPRIAPALLAIPWLLLRLRRNPRDPLSLLALSLGALVVFGGLSGQWTFGRLIAHVAILLHVALADAAAFLEERIRERRRALAPLFAPALAALLIAASWPARITPTLRESWNGNPEWLSFLESRVQRYDVILTDVDTCWYVPTFRGKVVAFPMQLPFVPDHAERLQDVARFFEDGVPAEERRAIVERRGVTHVLLPKEHFDDWRTRLAELRSLGDVLYSSADYELLQVR
jgi:hypothetical protein